MQKLLDVSKGIGYLNSIDLTTYNLISDLLPKFITDSPETKTLLYLNGDYSKETYKWLYNIIILNLYYLCLSSLQSMKLIDLELELEDLNVITDLKIQEQENTLVGKLDP